jgi:hypothetical protein
MKSIKPSLDERTVFEVEDGITRKIGENPSPSSAPWAYPDQYRNQDLHRDPGAPSASPAGPPDQVNFGTTPALPLTLRCELGELHAIASKSRCFHSPAK